MLVVHKCLLKNNDVTVKRQIRKQKAVMKSTEREDIKSTGTHVTQIMLQIIKQGIHEISYKL